MDRLESHLVEVRDVLDHAKPYEKRGPLREKAQLDLLFPAGREGLPGSLDAQGGLESIPIRGGHAPLKGLVKDPVLCAFKLVTQCPRWFGRLFRGTRPGFFPLLPLHVGGLNLKTFALRDYCVRFGEG